MRDRRRGMPEVVETDPRQLGIIANPKKVCEAPAKCPSVWQVPFRFQPSRNSPSALPIGAADAPAASPIRSEVARPFDRYFPSWFRSVPGDSFFARTLQPLKRAQQLNLAHLKIEIGPFETKDLTFERPHGSVKHHPRFRGLRRILAGFRVLICSRQPVLFPDRRPFGQNPSSQRGPFPTWSYYGSAPHDSHNPVGNCLGSPRG